MITGEQGFIGSKIKDREGYIFLFGSPSSQILFSENIDKCYEETINGFLNAIQYCRDHDLKLIYPSSATVYDKNNSYSRCKGILEEIALAYDTPTLGLRIFAGYGPGEGHKGRYASVVYQFCQQMKQGRRPVIYGDGEQTRDFVYIDDIVSEIDRRRDEMGVIDIGTGENTSFNRIVDIINSELKTNIEPIYVGKPKGYIEDTVCQNPLKDFISIEEGICKLLSSETV